MRIAIVHHLMEPRGGGFHCAHLADGLDARGFEVRLYGQAGPATIQLEPRQAPSTFFDASHFQGDEETRFFNASQEFSRSLSGCNLDTYDVIHVHDALDASAVFSLGLRRPVLVRTVHHLPEVPTARLERVQEAGVIEPDVLVVVSRFWQEVLRTRFRRDSWRVTNGIDSARLHPGAPFDRARFRKQFGGAGCFVFLAVGGISPRKGSDALIGALAKLKDWTDQRALLIIVGGDSFNTYDEYRKEVLSYAEELGLKDGTDFLLTGTVSETDIGGWYHSADALVFPSMNEGWGLAILEAMRVGLPVVASDIPVFREFLTHEDAIMVPSGDAEEIAKGMLRVMKDDELRDRLKTRGASLVQAFTWERCVDDYLPVFQQAGEQMRGRE